MFSSFLPVLPSVMNICKHSMFVVISNDFHRLVSERGFFLRVWENTNNSVTKGIASLLPEQCAGLLIFLYAHQHHFIKHKCLGKSQNVLCARAEMMVKSLSLQPSCTQVTWPPTSNSQPPPPQQARGRGQRMEAIIFLNRSSLFLSISHLVGIQIPWLPVSLPTKVSNVYFKLTPSLLLPLHLPTLYHLTFLKWFLMSLSYLVCHCWLIAGTEASSWLKYVKRSSGQ